MKKRTFCQIFRCGVFIGFFWLVGLPSSFQRQKRFGNACR